MTDYRNLFELDGKVALVTGAAGGIGSEACRALASAGAAVLVTDSFEEKGRVIAEEIRSSGARAERGVGTTARYSRSHGVLGG